MEKTNTIDMQMFCVGYLRVSSTEQATNFSLEAQTEAVNKEAAARGYTLTKIFSDPGYSATTTNRPGLIQLLTYCKDKRNKISAVVIYKIDRLSRDTADYLGLRRVLAEAGVKLASCSEPIDETPGSEFLETILAAAARYDNEIKRERIKRGIVTRFKNGFNLSIAPFGYNNVLEGTIKTLAIEKTSGLIIHDAFLEYSKGTHTLSSLAGYLNSKLTLAGMTRKFYKQQVARLLKNQTYCGYAVSKKHGIIKSDKIPPIIDEALFYKVRSILLNKGKQPNVHRKVRPEFPLRGLVQCGVCQKPLTAGFSKNAKGNPYGYYFCQTPGHLSKRDNVLDEAMVKLLNQLTPDPLLRKLYIDSVKEKYSSQYMDLVKQEDQVKNKLKDLEEQQTIIARKNATGIIRDDVANAAISQIDSEIAAIKTIKSESKLAQLDIEVLTKFMDALLADLSLFYSGDYAVGLKRIYISSIFTKMPVFTEYGLEHYQIDDAFNLKGQQQRGIVTLGAPERT